ncbi:hypothetical protein [Candidatus Magnetomonas plexicatena]
MELRCMECGARFLLSEYIDEIDANTWNYLSNRPCDTV